MKNKFLKNGPRSRFSSNFANADFTKNQQLENSLQGKKVLLIGLGLLGGGINAANWLIEQGAKLTITDLKTNEQLAPSLGQLKNKSRIKFVLGEHREKDFLDNEIVVVNPDVPLSSPFLKLAVKHKKQIENELTLFWKFSQSKNIIAVTGTRGKTTTTNWIGHFVKSARKDTQVAGNSPQNPLLDAISKSKPKTPFVLEVPSFLLEHSLNSGFAPKVAVITNISPDHLNRYRNLSHYALTKANIFKKQTANDYLILGCEDNWTKTFLKQKPKSKVLFFSTKQLPVGEEGCFVSKNRRIVIRFKGKESVVCDSGIFVTSWGAHNLKNLLATVLAARVFGLPLNKIIPATKTLPQIKFREELVYSRGGLEIYNDTAATSPEATIAALERFAKPAKNLILITGGTDRNLEFKKLAETMKSKLNPKQVIFLNGSATQKLKKELGWERAITLETLEECLDNALKMARKSLPTVILFSPGAKSF